MADNVYYVYEHTRPNSDISFYVGKGTKNRAYHNYGRNEFWHRVVNKHNGFNVRFIAKDIDEELAYLIEEERIDQLKRLKIKLVNLTSGGKCPNWIRVSRKTRQKISKIHKNVPKSDEWKRKVSVANTGKKRTLAIRQKMSQIKTKPLFCITEKKYFNSPKEASIYYNIHISNITRACRGERKTAKGMEFRYIEFIKG